MSEFIISGFYDEISGSLCDQIAEIKKLGESYLCPRSINGKNIAEYTADEFEKDILPVLKKEGIKLSSIGSPIGKVGIDDDENFEKQKKQLAELIKIARLTECKYIRVFSFFYGDKNPDDCFEKVVDRMKQFVAIAEGSGVVLMHENEKKIYGDRPERCLKLLKAVGSDSLTLCFDASNYVQCDVNPVDAFEMLKDYVAYYHIKDCSKYKVEVPVGTGEGCYPYILGQLKKSNYQGFVTLEPHTWKYALLKLPVYFIPFMPVVMKSYFKAFREIDGAMHVSPFKPVSRKQVFEWQYFNLKKLLEQA